MYYISNTKKNMKQPIAVQNQDRIDEVFIFTEKDFTKDEFIELLKNKFAINPNDFHISSEEDDCIDEIVKVSWKVICNLPALNQFSHAESKVFNNIKSYGINQLLRRNRQRHNRKSKRTYGENWYKKLL